VKEVLTKPSNYSVKETIDRLVIFLQCQDITIYARINHQVELRRFNQHIRPFEFILCGNPQVSGPFIEKDPLMALDLPLRIIAWEDSDSKCWVAYKDTIWLELENIIGKALSANS
jgi:uncharacterized protein (DUF302 family)